jgi:cyanophycin synthetase
MAGSNDFQLTQVHVMNDFARDNAAHAHTTDALASRRPSDEPCPQWLGSSILRGCNIHHERTVLCVDVDMGMLHGLTSAHAGADFCGRFTARFHDAAHLPPTAAPNQAFFDALRSDRGAPFDEVLLEAILAIERRLAHTSHNFVPIGFARIENIASPAQPRRTRLVWESHSPGLSRAAARLALASLLELLAGLLDPGCPVSPSDFETELAVLLRRAGRRQVSTTVSVIALAAHARGIPCESIGGPHLQLGHGARQRFVYSSASADISLGAAQLSCNKRRTAQRLRQIGLPATRQIVAGSASEAMAAAASLGYPVVVKPQKGKQGGGVSVGIAQAADMAAAFERASADGSGVLVEEFVRGRTYRLLVIGGRFAAALEISVPSVRGNGSSRIGDLIEALNRDPMRNGIRLFEVEVDDDLRDCLARSGHTLNDIPPAGAEIALRTAANVAIGGVHHEVSDLVHASHRDLAERAAAAIGLTVAGIDVVSADIGQSCSEAGTRIIEVNARPGLCMHTFPRHGQGRDVAGALLEQAFPDGATGRVRTALVIGRRGAGTTARELDALWRANGITAGLVAHKHAAIGGQAIGQDALTQHEALALMHRDARLEALAVAASPRRAVARGLALESAEAVAVLKPVTQIDIEIHAQVVDLARRAARGVIVADADDRIALNLLETAMERSRLILIGTDPNHRAIDNHLALGGAAVLVAPDDSRATVLRGGQTLEVLHRAQAQPSADGRIARAQWLAAVLHWSLPA